MKKSILAGIILLFCSVGCQSGRELYETVPSSDSPIFEYEWHESALSSSEIPLITGISRGFLFFDNDILRVYNPVSNTMTNLCTDPLCTHGFGSECLYQYCVFGSAPQQLGDRLYWYDVEKDPAMMEDMTYRICSSDLFGQDGKVLYRTSNYIAGLLCTADTIYFTETVSDRHTILRSVTTDGKNLHTMPYTEDIACHVDSFVCLNDMIYYISDGLFSSCTTDLKNLQDIMPLDNVTLYADSKHGKLYYQKKEFYAFDPVSGEAELLAAPPDSMTLSRIDITEDGFYYQYMPAGINRASLYADYAAALRGNNILYYYDFSTGETREYVLPDSLLIFACRTEKDNMFGMYCVENKWTGNISGSGYFVYDLQNDTIHSPGGVQ